MSETTTQALVGRAMLRVTTVCLHIVQLILAITILCTDAYSVEYAAYNILVCSLAVSICTILVCIYLIVAHILFRKLYSHYAVAAYHIWMLIFWIVNLGLAAHLVDSWGDDGRAYDFRNEHICVLYNERLPRSIPYNQYYRLLVTRALLAALELVLWVLTTSFIFVTWRRYRAEHISVSVPPAPRNVITLSNFGNINMPFDDTSHASEEYTHVFHVPAPADPWDRPIPERKENRGQIIPDTSSIEDGSPMPSFRERGVDPLAGLTFETGNGERDKSVGFSRARSLDPRSIINRKSGENLPLRGSSAH